GQENKKMPTGEVEVLAESVEILNVCHKLPCEIKDFVKVSRLYDYAYIMYYFQLAQCYRDEGSKPDRQPARIHPGNAVISYFSTPLPCMMYEEAMKDYGGDMPDTRFLMDISETFPNTEIEFLKEALNQPGSCFQAMCVPDGAVSTVKLKPIFFLTQFNQVCLPHVLKNPAAFTIHSSIVRLQRLFCEQAVEDQCILKINIYFFHDDCSFESPDFHYFLPQCPLLGKLRLQCAETLEGSSMAVGNPSAFHFLWVVDFPLFLPKEDDPEQLDSAHHPFTEPLPEDTHLLHSQCEIGGGSILIHKASEQQHVLETILKDDPSLLSHLLEALDSGAPPHGGIAWGLDRLVSIIVGTPSIRDVIAFPNSFRGHDLMNHAPDFVSENELKPYHISTEDTVTIKLLWFDKFMFLAYNSHATQ
uniref:Aspartyl-tRNA synthetase 2, mitochondrial n=1 Tax=Oncorhynchus kisutch TaxID=8019 RepID=A0A8C7IQR4_ONCKI